MIYTDKKNEMETQTSMADYLASFWNPAAVKKIQESRSKDASHRFLPDTEFEDHVRSGSYKDNPILDAVIKMRELEGSNNKRLREKAEDSKTKKPTDLASIQDTLRKFNG